MKEESSFFYHLGPMRDEIRKLNHTMFQLTSDMECIKYTYEQTNKKNNSILKLKFATNRYNTSSKWKGIEKLHQQQKDYPKMIISWLLITNQIRWFYF